MSTRRTAVQVPARLSTGFAFDGISTFNLSVKSLTMRCRPSRSAILGSHPSVVFACQEPLVILNSILRPSSQPDYSVEKS